jgi:hypothetical protein
MPHPMKKADHVHEHVHVNVHVDVVSRRLSRNDK